MGDRPFILHVARVQRRGQLEHEDVRFFLGDRPVFDAAGNDRHVSLFEPDMPILELHAEAALHHQEEFVLVLVLMSDELTENLCQLDMLAVEFADDLRFPAATM